jgi:preprotein translocase SecE subunit
MSYFRSVIREVKSINFPTGRSVKIISFVVLVIVLISMFFIGFADFLISKLIKILLGII